VTPHIASTAVGASVRLAAIEADHFSVDIIVVCFLEVLPNFASLFFSSSANGLTSGLHDVFRHVVRDCMRTKPRDARM